MERIKVTEVTKSDTLAGKIPGMRDFPKFLSAVENTPESSTVILDWTGVEIATASYFGATFVRLLRMTTAGDLDRYLAVTGLNSTCMDELKLALEIAEVVALLIDGVKGRGDRSVQVLGNLDPAYVQTIAEVQKCKGVSASELHRRQMGTNHPIGKTGWINRLSNLYRLRLVRKEKQGRESVFRSVMLEV